MTHKTTEHIKPNIETSKTNNSVTVLKDDVDFRNSIKRKVHF